MNNLTKVRIWDKDKKAFLARNEFAITGNCTLLLTKTGWYADFTNEAHLHLSQRYVVQHYAGLSDKNGEEIYEGDIVNYFLRGDSLEGDLNFNGKVEWVKCGFRILPLPEDYRSAYKTLPIEPPESSVRISVIGNIFETPELLEK
jgi:uncharacterized phage protein (TIGR01671 family)